MIAGGGRKPFLLSETSSLCLDIIRILASQAVVVGHSISFLQILKQLQPPQFPYIQNIAVVVFFLLSGFLITYTVSKKTSNRSYGFKIYFIDRFARIYSGFIPALIFIAIVDYFYISLWGNSYQYVNAYNIKTFIGNVFMLQDYPFFDKTTAGLLFFLRIPKSFLITSFGSGRPLWTIAIEWWIYMSFGWLVLRNRLKKKNKIIYFVIALFFLIVPIYNLFGGRGSFLTLAWLMGSFIFVCLKYDFLHRIKPSFSFLLSIFFLSISFIRVYSTKHEYELLFALLIASSLLFFIYFTQQSRIFISSTFKKIVNFAAGYSLTLYLIHYSILYISLRLRFFGISNAKVLFFIPFILSNCLSIALAFYTEMKYRKLAAFLKSKTLD